MLRSTERLASGTERRQWKWPKLFFYLLIISRIIPCASATQFTETLQILNSACEWSDMFGISGHLFVVSFCPRSSALTRNLTQENYDQIPPSNHENASRLNAEWDYDSGRTSTTEATTSSTEAITSTTEATTSTTEASTRFSQEEQLEFYEFCNDTKIKLGRYETQVKLLKLLEQNNGHLNVDNDNPLQFLTEKNLTRVSSKISELWPKVGLCDRKRLVALIRESNPQSQIKFINSTLHDKKFRVVISGQNVLLSDAFNGSRWPPDYRNITLVKEVSVVATGTIFFDTDMHTQSREIHVSMIAPTWEVVLFRNQSKRSINLNGESPSSEAEVNAGTYPWGNGRNGDAGKAGGNAGTFFGLYSQIHNAERLFISANGGHGADGQDGGNGTDGAPGEDGSGDEFPNALWGSKKESKYMLQTYYADTESWTSLGRPGKKGGNGGDGGDGGQPGNAGSIFLIAVNNLKGESSNIAVSSNPGEWGRLGMGGRGGKGGRRGNNHTCDLGFLRWYDCESIKSGEFAASGQNGTVGIGLLRVPYHLSADKRNATIIFRVYQIDKMPCVIMDANGRCKNCPLCENIDFIKSSKGTVVPNFEPWRAISEFRLAAFQNAADGDFLTKMESIAQVQELYSVLAFADELNAMEELFYEMREEKEERSKRFLHYYERFLYRLKDFANKTAQKNKRITDQEAAALDILQATVLGKIIGMKRSNELELNVIDTEEYFDALVKELEILKTRQKEAAVRQEDQRFGERLDERIREAAAFIRTNVNPAIRESKLSLDELDEKVLAEIQEYLRAAETNVENKKQLEKKFKMLLPLQNLLAVMNVAGTVCNFFGPKGMAVGGSILTATSIAESFLPAKHVDERGSLKLPSSFTDMLEEKNKEYYERKIRRIEAKVNLSLRVSQMADGNEFGDIAEKANKTRASLGLFKNAVENGQGGKMSQAQIVHLEKDADKSMEELIASVAKKRNEVEAEEKAGQEKKKSAERKQKRNSKIIKQVTKIMDTVESVKNLVDLNIGSEAELEKLVSLVEEAEESVKAVEIKMKAFDHEFIPQMESIYKHVRKQSSDLPGQSQVALSVKKWKIKGLLQNMRRYVQEFANGFKVTERFQLSFDKLDEAFTLLIDLYEHIERYEEKRELAQLIVNVNIAGSSGVQITDVKLQSLVKRVEFYAHANLFLESYQKGMHSFKQWVFPFANHYLAGKDHEPPGLVPKDLDELLERYKGQVEHLQVELAKYKATTAVWDEALMITTFTSDAVSSKPFYIWKGSKFQNSISMLLSGQPVDLKADVDMITQEVELVNFFRWKSAIKFRTIELNIKTHNASRQVELNEKLSHFQMSMTHSGISLYKVLGKKFVMFDRNQTYRYSFEQNVKNGKGHVSMNGVKYKVTGPSVDFLMSPYTWWTFKLIDATPEFGMGFQDLKEFSKQVDLELKGDGVYLDEERAPKNLLEGLRLADYYQAYSADDKQFMGKEKVHYDC